MDQNKSIDDLLKDIVKSEGLTPSPDFTYIVMNAVLHEKKNPLVYKPLIPASVLWSVALLIVFATILFSSGYIQTGDHTSTLYKIINAIKLPSLSLQIPAVATYIIGSILILVMIQAFVLSGFYRRIYK